jgi:hypothetical protein
MLGSLIMTLDSSILAKWLSLGGAHPITTGITILKNRSIQHFPNNHTPSHLPGQSDLSQVLEVDDTFIFGWISQITHCQIANVV